MTERISYVRVLDIRCRDVARILAEGPKKREEIEARLHEKYPKLKPGGSWVRNILLKGNPLVGKTHDNVWTLSDLGKAFIKLPGELGSSLTTEEKIFLIGLVMLDEKQRKVVSEIIALGKSTYSNKFIVDRTRRVLTDLGLLKPE